MSSVFQAGTIIAVVAILASMVNNWIKHQKTPEVDLSDIESRLGSLESLKERVKILEAIVTDKGYDLKREIDSLR